MEWKIQLQQYRDQINAHLEKIMEQAKKSPANQLLIEAMSYSLLAQGKRLRPVLAMAAYEMFGSDLTEMIPYGCGLEMIHAYSLIHDDLPAMDNDDYRRGRLTNHLVYGEGNAILAGDGLLNHAFEIMLADAMKRTDPTPYVRAMYEISQGAGVNGMIGGQTADLAGEGKSIAPETLTYIHLHKTGALIKAALKAGALIGGGTLQDVENLQQVGYHLGLAFQIQDDILDIVGDAEKLGKPVGSDENNHKATYPALYGLSESKEQVKCHTLQLQELLKPYGQKADFLIHLSQHLINRES